MWQLMSNLDGGIDCGSVTVNPDGLLITTFALSYLWNENFTCG